MAGKAPRVYWDTNVFIYLFNGYQGRSAEEIKGIRYWRDQADDDKAVIVTSALTYAEVIDQRLTDAQYKLFDAFMLGRVDVKDASIGVMRRVKELREDDSRRPRRKGQKHKLCTPDAIHLATGLVFGCGEFHTFDQRAKNKCTGLLSLGNAFTGMQIRIPEAPHLPEDDQQMLFDGNGASAIEEPGVSRETHEIRPAAASEHAPPPPPR